MKKLKFGIYGGGAAGSDNGMARGPEDNRHQINESLSKLHAPHREFLLRAYLHYLGSGKFENLTPANPKAYLQNGRKLDLVLGYQSKDGDLKEWANFIRTQITEYGPQLAKIQIGEEPNLHNIPYVDGDSPNVRMAVIEGVIAAKEECKKQKLDTLVGFNGVPTFDPNNDFWREIGTKANANFYGALDYVGLDFFPDVFRPVPAENLEKAVESVLAHFREVSLAEAKIDKSVPIHITENGWATSPERPYEKQAIVLEIIIKSINHNKEKFNITHYEHFSLRDANSSNTNFFFQFGLLKDDYTPKPAFDVYRRLISELG
jgi:hypothetical protein